MSLHAKTLDIDSNLEKLGPQLNEVEKTINDGLARESDLKQWARQVANAKLQASNCVEDQGDIISKLDADIAALGESLKNEPYAVTEKRIRLHSDRRQADNQLGNCRYLQLRLEEVKNLISDTQTRMLSERLFNKGPSILKLITENWTKTLEWLWSDLSFLVVDSSILLPDKSIFPWLALILPLSALIGIPLRMQFRHLLLKQQWDPGFTAQFLLSLLESMVFYLPYLLATSALSITIFAVHKPDTSYTLFEIGIYGLSAFLFFMAIIRILFYSNENKPALSGFPTDAARGYQKNLHLLLLLSFLGLLAFYVLHRSAAPTAAILLFRAIYAPLLFVILAWSLWLLGKTRIFANITLLYALFYLLLVSALIAEWLGYRNLSLSILRAEFGTLLAAGSLALLKRLLEDLFNMLEQGQQEWQQRLRIKLGLESEATLPGLLWVRAIAHMSVWFGFIYICLYIWGLSDATLQSIREFLLDGFNIGTLHIVPVRLIMGFAIFGVLILVSGWFRNNLNTRWLPRMQINRGSREAIVTISWYIGITSAILVALSIAGVEFENLAIIVGALSVGIGFGLQNIVNNFVSGIILLFERPIKTGDWIVAGDTEGYVKRIRIRSTQIQTFDRADVIVPNSELISSQVTNWMLYDTQGRVRIPVGVAYGSDTQKVKELLLEVANNHPLVIKKRKDMLPVVLFLAFGDSSLDFELRVYISNVDKRLSVLSDLNFAIDATFRANNVEIPFPQRDVHVRDANMHEPNPKPQPTPPKDGETGAGDEK